MLKLIDTLAEKLYYTFNPREAKEENKATLFDNWKYKAGSTLKKDMYSPNYNQKLFTYIKIKDLDKTLRVYKVDIHIVSYNMKNGWFASKDVNSQLDFGVPKEQFELTDYNIITDQQFIDGITLPKEIKT